MRYASVTDLPQQHRAEAERQLRGDAPRAPLIHTGNLGAGPIGCIDFAAAKPKKPSKYRNVRVFLDGEWYDSQKEYEFHQVLKDRQRRGEIGMIFRQYTIRLEGDVRYRADYIVTTAEAPHHCEIWDVKGFDTRSSINKRKQVLARYGVEVRLWPPRAPKGE